VTAAEVSLREITDENRPAVAALRVAPGQEQFVASRRVEDGRTSSASPSDWPQDPYVVSPESSGPVGPIGLISWK
jgi:hypothetical protein